MSVPPQNPYRAPGAMVADQDLARGSAVKAVIYGVLVDIIGTTLAGVVLVFGYGIVLSANGASGEEIARAAAQIDPASAIGLMAIALGSAFSFLGGYVCARVAGESELKYAAVVAGISVAFGFLTSMEAYSIALHLILAALGFGVVMLGGYAGARRNAAKP